MLRFCLWALFATLFFSCLSEPDCIITASNEVVISWKWPTGDSARFIKFDSILVSGTDSVFYVGDSVSRTSLPVNPGIYQTSFHFFYEAEEDSLTVSYTRNTRVISPACGAFNYFQDLSVVLYTFPSVTVTNSELSTSGLSNLTIKL